MELSPYGSRIIVKKEMKDKVGLIVIPEEAKQASLLGIVVAAGPECTKTSVGDKILFGRFGFFDLPLNDGYEDCVLMNEEDVLAEVFETTKLEEVNA